MDFGQETIEDTWITEFLVDTAKIRTFKMLSNTGGNGGSL